jgi:hypothetical protein
MSRTSVVVPWPFSPSDHLHTPRSGALDSTSIEEERVEDSLDSPVQDRDTAPFRSTISDSSLLQYPYLSAQGATGPLKSLRTNITYEYLVKTLDVVADVGCGGNTSLNNIT